MDKVRQVHVSLQKKIKQHNILETTNYYNKYNMP